MREHRSAQLPAPRRPLAGLTEGAVLFLRLVWKLLRPGVMMTPAARFSRLDAPFVSCTCGHALSAGVLLAGKTTGFLYSDPCNAADSIEVGVPVAADHWVSPVLRGLVCGSACDVLVCLCELFRWGLSTPSDAI